MSRKAVNILLGMLLAAAAPVAAQTLESGIWTGTVSPPDGGTRDVEYVVSNDDGLAILLVFEMGEIPFEDIGYDGSLLTFSWDIGTFLVCELQKLESGGFEGECVDDAGVSGFLTMDPPSGGKQMR